MKTTKLILTGLFVFGALTLQAQNTAETADVTSGGLQSGNYGTGNTFYGYRAGLIAYELPDTPVGGNNNTLMGDRAGIYFIGSDNVFIGYNSRVKHPVDRVNISGNGNVFIGANTSITTTSSVNNRLIIDNSATTNPLIWGDFAEDLLKFNGKVGVGFDFGSFPAMAGTVDVSDYNLFVYGGILTEEVRVMLEEDWADYVFEEEYNLPKLEEVEQFIKENKHLPNVPSAKEVAENGIELGEIAKIQQEKIEELTLYLIEQNKIIKQQQQELYDMKARIEVLENQK